MVFDYTDQEKEEEKISKINSAALVNLTLNNLWVDCFRHLRTGEYLKWNNDLDAIWIILGGDIFKEDVEKEFMEIEKELSNSGNLTNGGQLNGFKVVAENYMEKLSKQKAILMKKSLFLKRLQNAQGKGTAYQDEDEGDFD